MLPQSKKWIYLTVAITFTGILALYILYRNAGSLVTYGINEFAPKFTGVETHISRAYLNPWSGKGSIRNFFLGNPKGFQTEAAVTADKISISVKSSSLMSPLIEVRDLTIDGPVITWEGSLSKNNLSEIQKNISQNKGEHDSKGPAIKIANLKITNAKVRISIFGGAPTTLSLPSIQLTNLGGSSGISGSEIAAKVFGEIVSSTSREIVKAPGLLQTGTQKLLKSIQGFIDLK